MRQPKTVRIFKKTILFPQIENRNLKWYSMFLLLRLGLSKHWRGNLFYDPLYRSIGCWSWAKRTAARSLETTKKEIVSRRLYAIRIDFFSREIRPDFLAVGPNDPKY